MFVGQVPHTLDEKNRLVLPAKFRDSFGSSETDRGIYVTVRTKAQASFLTLMAPAAWQREIERLERMAEATEDGDWFMRKFCWDAEYCKLDPQWRVMIPVRLTEAAGLKREVMVVGNFRSIEVWDGDTWKREDERLRHQAPLLEKSLYRARPGGDSVPRGASTDPV